MKKRTKTSSFGVSKREGHDSSQFYNSKLYEGLISEESNDDQDNSHLINESNFGKIIDYNDESKGFVLDASIHLIIHIIPKLTSDFVDAGPNSKLDNQLKELFLLWKNALVSGGRLIIITNNSIERDNRLEFYPFHSVLNKHAISSGFLMRGEIILTDGETSQQDTSKDTITPESMCSHELRYARALVYSKKVFNRNKKSADKSSERTNSISRDLFLEATKSVWFPSPVEGKELQSRINLFDDPVSLMPYIQRMIELYSFVEDSVIVCSVEIGSGFFDLLNHRGRIQFVRKAIY